MIDIAEMLRTYQEIVQSSDAKEHLDQIKQRSRVVQLLCAGVLFGAAAIAVVVSPTAAFVFAALAVTGVWMLPATRRLSAGGKVALRDPMGRPRLLMAATNEGTYIQFLDNQARARLTMALGASDAPIVALTDPDGQVRGTLACDAATGNAVLSLTGENGQQLTATAPPSEDPYLIVQSDDAHKTIITANDISLEGPDGDATVLTSSNDTRLHCGNGTSQLDLMLHGDFTGMLVHTSQNTGLLGINAGAVVVEDQAAMEANASKLGGD